jgi:hypothetical protein
VEVGEEGVFVGPTDVETGVFVRMTVVATGVFVRMTVVATGVSVSLTEVAMGAVDVRVNPSKGLELAACVVGKSMTQAQIRRPETNKTGLFLFINNLLL